MVTSSELSGTGARKEELYYIINFYSINIHTCDSIFQGHQSFVPTREKLPFIGWRGLTFVKSDEKEIGFSFPLNPATLCMVEQSAQLYMKSLTP